jgi:hypothetical protein
VALAADGTGGISASDDGTLRLSDIETGEVVRVFTGQLGKLRNCD